MTMDSVFIWNVRGLNGPNKQEVVHNLLRMNKCFIASLVETKTSICSCESIKDKICPSWSFVHNASATEKGRIWVLWEPHHAMHILLIKRQFIHCRWDNPEGKQLSMVQMKLWKGEVYGLRWWLCLIQFLSLGLLLGILTVFYLLRMKLVETQYRHMK